MLSSHFKRSPSLWLHNKSRLWKQADLVFQWCLYSKQNITYSFMDMNFIFSCSTRYLPRSLIREISRWPLEDKIHIHARACNIFYLFSTDFSTRLLGFMLSWSQILDYCLQMENKTDSQFVVSNSFVSRCSNYIFNLLVPCIKHVVLWGKNKNNNNKKTQAS